MYVAIASPPPITDFRRPTTSEKSVAGIVAPRIASAETPEARKDAVWDDRPACRKSRGA